MQKCGKKQCVGKQILGMFYGEMQESKVCNIV